MPIKISQLTELTVIDGTVVVPVVDNSGPTPVSKKSTIANVSAHILSGNAATATKLATARNINGVAFDGTADINITTSVPDASDTIKGLVLIPVVGTSGITNSSGTIGLAVASSTQKGAVIIPDVSTSGITNSSGTIGLAVATSSQLGGVKVGAGINIAVDGTLSGPTRKFHGFGVDDNSNLIYYTTQDTTINLQDQYGADIYEDVDIGTNEYSYSLDADGNLIVTYS
jgi:hypothetical protein